MFDQDRTLIRNTNQWEFQDPKNGGVLVPYVWPYEFWGYSLT